MDIDWCALLVNVARRLSSNMLAAEQRKPQRPNCRELEFTSEWRVDPDRARGTAKRAHRPACWRPPRARHPPCKCACGAASCAGGSRDWRGCGCRGLPGGDELIMMDTAGDPLDLQLQATVTATRPEPVAVGVPDLRKISDRSRAIFIRQTARARVINFSLHRLQ
jgi:hypothetical protein